MIRNLSPLRYPGGKSILSSFFRSVIYENRLQSCDYVELFAGGAGAAVELLASGHVERIIINDADRAIYCFWNSLRRRANELIDRILSIPLTVKEWKKQKEIYRTGGRQKEIDLGFAAFYLNRCNRSGIIKNAGPIGGLEQKGEWKINARFNRQELAGRVRELASYGDRIRVTNEDAISLLHKIDDVIGSGPKFIYADPPYYVKGRELYLSYFNKDDHELLAVALSETKQPWVLTYDNVSETRKLYSRHNVIEFNLRYSAHHNSSKGGEILVCPAHVSVSKRAREALRSLWTS